MREETLVQQLERMEQQEIARLNYGAAQKQLINLLCTFLLVPLKVWMIIYVLGAFKPLILAAAGWLGRH